MAIKKGLGFGVPLTGTDNPVMRPTRPMQVPDQPDSASIILQAAGLDSRNQQMKIEERQAAVRGLTDALFTVKELQLRKQKQDTDAAAAAAVIELHSAQTKLAKRAADNGAQIVYDAAGKRVGTQTYTTSGTQFDNVPGFGGGMSPNQIITAGQFEDITGVKTGKSRDYVFSPAEKQVWMKRFDMQNRPMSGEAAKVEGNVKQGSTALRAMIEALKTHPKADMMQRGAVGLGGGVVAALSQDTDVQGFRQNMKNATDVITRLRTGAALNASEEKFYTNLLGGRYKTREAYINALEQTATFFDQVEADIQAGRRTFTFTKQAAAAPAGKTEEMVGVQFPDGRRGKVPKSKLLNAISRGAKQL